MTPAEAVRKAAGILGGQTALASRLDVRTPTVSQWCSGDRPVPVARAIQVEALTTERDFLYSRNTNDLQHRQRAGIERRSRPE